MPLKRCTVDGKSGWKYGDSGTCYVGENGKQKAIKQGVAIEKNRGGTFHASIKEKIFAAILEAMV